MSAEETPPLLEALRVQLRTILDRPITARMFLELEQTARLARSLFVLSQMPDTKTAGLEHIGSPMLSEGLSPMLGSSLGYSYGSMYGSSLTASPQTETFGATMVRELVAALPALMKPKETVVRESASSLVDAIAAARENKLEDVAIKLKAKLDALLAEEPTPTHHAGPPGAPNGTMIVHAEPIDGATVKANGAGEEHVHEVVLP